MKVSCRTGQESLLFVRSNRIITNQSALAEVGLETDSVTCYYQYIAYITEEEYSFQEKIKIESNEVELSELYNSVYATCYTKSDTTKPIYRNILIYVPRLSNMVQLEDQAKYSVFILIFDSLSRLMFLRSVNCSLK